MRRSFSESLNAYRQALSDLISELLRSREAALWNLLRLSKEKDSNFVWTAMYIIGDTSIAIQNFLRFGLNGPTRYDDAGERYLRLYGLLNAGYIQQEAVLKLYTLLNVPNPKEMKQRINHLQIRDLRHKIGAHGVDFMNKNISRVEPFVAVRATLKQFTCEYMNNDTQAFERVDLKECVEEHSKLMVEILATIYEKAAKTAYKGNDKKLREHNERLEDLKIMGDGGAVIKLADGKKLTIRLGSRNAK